MHESTTPVASLRAVTKTYTAGAVDVAAIHDLTLDIPAHRFTVIVGPSGSGKTTLLNLIGCLDTPTRGTIEIAGQRLDALDDDALSEFRARHLGFVFQNFNLIPVLSAYENVEYPLLQIDTPPAKRREMTLAMLDAVGLADRATQRPNQLSGGQQQRVAIARALVKGPSIVLADEPTANLDSHTSASIIALMQHMQAVSRTTFIFSTHDPRLMAHAEATFAIRDGVLVAPEGEAH